MVNPASRGAPSKPSASKCCSKPDNVLSGTAGLGRCEPGKNSLVLGWCGLRVAQVRAAPVVRRVVTPARHTTRMSELIGWRSWSLQVCGPNRWRISAYAGSIWPTRRLIKAFCNYEGSHHQPPALGCGCGIYSRDDPDVRFLTYVDADPNLHRAPIAAVYGSIAPKGEVVRRVGGSRAEAAEVRSLEIYCATCWRLGEGVVAASHVDVLQDFNQYGLQARCAEHATPRMIEIARVVQRAIVHAYIGDPHGDVSVPEVPSAQFRWPSLPCSWCLHPHVSHDDSGCRAIDQNAHSQGDSCSCTTFEPENDWM